MQHLLEGKECHYFLFTDDKDPQSLAKALSEQMLGQKIFFEQRDSGTSPKESILKDFALLQSMDALIISQSSFSFVAAHTGSASIIIMPTNSTTKDGEATIDKTSMFINGISL